MNASLPRHRSLRDTSGSVMLASILFTLVLAAIVGLYLESVSQELENAHRTRLMLETVNLAETGAEDAIAALLADDWSSWSDGSHGYSRTSYLPGGTAGETRIVRTFIDMTDPEAPSIVTEAQVSHPIGVKSVRQLRIDLDQRGVFANGLTSRNGVSMNGNNVGIDSYNSGSGNYDSTTNRNDYGSVASVSVAVDAVDIQNADVWGFIATGGSAPIVGKNGSVLGSDSPSGVKIDPNRVSTDFYANFDQVSAPTLTSPFTTVVAGTMGVAATKTEYKLSSLTVNSSSTLNVTGDVTLVVDGDIDVKGELNISAGSTLTVYVGGNLTVGGNGIVNATNVPSSAVIFATGGPGDGQEVKLHGNGSLIAAVYAPFAEVSMKGGGSSGEMMGAVVGGTINITGNYAFHYDEALNDYGTNGKFSLVGWRELESNSLRYDDVLALKDIGL